MVIHYVKHLERESLHFMRIDTFVVVVVVIVVLCCFFPYFFGFFLFGGGHKCF